MQRKVCAEGDLTRDCSMLFAVVIFMCFAEVPSSSLETGYGKEDDILSTTFHRISHDTEKHCSLLKVNIHMGLDLFQKLYLWSCTHST